MKIRLTYWRLKKVLSKEELAHKAGLNPNTIARIESGVIKPYPKTLRKLAEALGISVEELVVIEDEDGLLAKVG